MDVFHNMVVDMERIITMEGYENLYSLPEDKRINAIGNYVLNTGLTACIVIEDEVGKRERYINKLMEKFEGLEIMEQGIGPVEGTLFFNVRKKRR